jgi:hypothetical protein
VSQCRLLSLRRPTVHVWKGHILGGNRQTDLPFVAQPAQEGTKTTLVQIAGDKYINVYRLVDQQDDKITIRYIVLAPGMGSGVHHIAISP